MIRHFLIAITIVGIIRLIDLYREKKVLNLKEKMKLFNLIMICLLWLTMAVWLIGIIAPLKAELNDLKRKVDNMYEVIRIEGNVKYEKL